MPVGQVGEIAIRGPQVMKGYWQRPEETAKAFTPDGWFRTGDMGFMDEQGRFKITDRKKDMIIVSGFKVFPNEVEDVVMMHPGVLEVAAIGAPDERSGEAVKIVVVKKDPALTESDAARALQEAPDRLQDAQARRVPHRAAAEDQHRQDPAPRTAVAAAGLSSEASGAGRAGRRQRAPLKQRDALAA